MNPLSAPAAPRPPPAAFWSPRRVAWFGGLLVAALAGQAAYDIHRSYRSTLQDAQHALESQSRVIAELSARTMQAIDAVLRHLADQHRRGVIDRFDAEALHAYLKEQAQGLVQVDGVAIFDAEGRGRASSILAPEEAVKVSAQQQPAFQRLRDDRGVGLAVGTTFRSTEIGRFVFPIGRRLQTPAGEFAGVVAAGGLVDYFQRFYRDAYPESGIRIGLLHRDNTLLARHPPADSALGRKIPIVEELFAAAAAGQTVKRHASPIDGVDRFGATREVPGYPLVVVVTRDVDSVLAGWRAQATNTALRTLALGALAVLLMVMVMRQLARTAAARASLATSEQRYALAAAGSDVGVWDWDMVAGTAYESRRAREVQGLPLEPETQPLAELRAALNYHPEDAGRRAAALQAHLDGDTAHYEVEYRVRRADGVYAWIHARALCIRDADGKPLRIAGSVSDIDARKRAEVALRESEERFSAAVAGSDDGIWMFDYVKGTAFTSQRSQQIIGAPPGPEVVPVEEGLAVLSRQLHPDDLSRRNQAIGEHLAGRADAYAGEFRVARAGGGWRWIRVHARCVFDDNGKPLRIAGSTSDIDDRKRAEAALRESEQRFAVAVAGSDDGIWLWDYTARTVFASQRARELSGAPDGPEVQAIDDWHVSMEQLLHPDDIARRRAAIQAHVSGNTPAYEAEYRVRAAQGGYRWLRVRGMCMRDAEGRPLRMAGSVSDIDASKRGEEALRQSEERYALAMAGSTGGHWVWDTQTDSLFVSDRVNELFGVPADQQPNTRTAFFDRVHLHEDDRARLLSIGDALTSGRLERADYEFRILTSAAAGGGERWILTRAQRFADPDGGNVRIAGVSVDIGERKRAEVDRARLEEQLRQAQKLEAIGTLAGGIAHDFNNILSAILGYGELAQKGAAEGSAQRRHIDAAIVAGQRAKSLVERILAFSRSGMGERVPVHVQSVVEEALDAVATSLPRGVKLMRRLEAGDAGVIGDPTQIHQVVMNLCANAVQAMKAAGRLDVSLDVIRLSVPLAVATHTLAVGEYLRLEVADTGGGMPPALLARIFDPFFTTKEVGVGTGLGLSLVHGIVTDLGGGIEVESREGAGSRFAVYVPSRTRVALARAEVAQSADLGRGQTVLLVDDEEALVRLGEETLAEIGYEPIGFTSAEAALAALKAAPERFDALLSDEAMPGLTGSELAREARALAPGLAIVLMSGYVTPALVQRAREAGVAEVLAKPLAAADIARALAAALSPNRTGAAASALPIETR